MVFQESHVAKFAVRRPFCLLRCDALLLTLCGFFFEVKLEFLVNLSFFAAALDKPD
jgi:hypothetical protein